MTLLYLERHGLIEKISDNEHMLPETVANIDSESDSAARVRNHRERRGQMLQSNGVNVTCNTEKEEDIETRRERLKRELLKG